MGRIRTRDDIKAYVEEMAARKATDQASVRFWQKLKMNQILALPEDTFFVPVSTPIVKSDLDSGGGMVFPAKAGTQFTQRV